MLDGTPVTYMRADGLLAIGLQEGRSPVRGLAWEDGQLQDQQQGRGVVAASSRGVCAQVCISKLLQAACPCAYYVRCWQLHLHEDDDD